MPSVLIVDDSAFIRAHIKQSVTRNGFAVAGEAENGRVALKMIRDVRPDIVTLDITMPEMNGVECIKEIKKLETRPVVIMISAMGQEMFVKEAILNGAAGFIVKPYKEETLMEYLNKYK